jgi:tight adherence protein B
VLAVEIARSLPETSRTPPTMVSSAPDTWRSLVAEVSAWVLASLPVVGTVGFSLLDPGVARVLLTTPAGWACLVVGGAMELTGVAVIRRLVGAVAP